MDMMMGRSMVHNASMYDILPQYLYRYTSPPVRASTERKVYTHEVSIDDYSDLQQSEEEDIDDMMIPTVYYNTYIDMDDSRHHTDSKDGATMDSERESKYRYICDEERIEKKYIDEIEYVRRELEEKNRKEEAMKQEVERLMRENEKLARERDPRIAEKEEEEKRRIEEIKRREEAERRRKEEEAERRRKEEEAERRRKEEEAERRRREAEEEKKRREAAEERARAARVAKERMDRSRQYYASFDIPLETFEYYNPNSMDLLDLYRMYASTTQDSSLSSHSLILLETVRRRSKWMLPVDSVGITSRMKRCFDLKHTHIDYSLHSLIGKLVFHKRHHRETGLFPESNYESKRFDGIYKYWM